MGFSSLLFLFAFLPAFFLLYSLVPSRLKNWALLLGSLVFYAWSAFQFVGMVIGTTDPLVLQWNREESRGFRG